MGRPPWFVELTKLVFPFRHTLAELTHVPVLGSLVDGWLFEGDHLVYLPPDRVIPVNEPLDRPGEMVLPSQVLEHFIGEASHHWVMDACVCREASRCQEYPIELGCLFLGEAASGIHPELGHPVTAEEALAHLQLCREAGLVHVVGRNNLDAVWLGVGPRHKLMTICNCCPCCCLWRALPHFAPEIGAKIARMPGVSVTVTERCKGCGICAQDICFVDAIHLSDSRATISDACRGCSRCVSACPEGAIELSVDDSEFVAQSTRRLAPLVDLS